MLHASPPQTGIRHDNKPLNQKKMKILEPTQSLVVKSDEKTGLSARVSEVREDGFRRYTITRNDTVGGREQPVEKGVLLNEYCDKFDEVSIRRHMTGYMKDLRLSASAV